MSATSLDAMCDRIFAACDSAEAQAEAQEIEKELTEGSELLELSLIDSNDNVHFRIRDEGKYRSVLGSYSHRDVEDAEDRNC